MLHEFLIHQRPYNFTYKYRLGRERLIGSGSWKCIMFVCTDPSLDENRAVLNLAMVQTLKLLI